VNFVPIVLCDYQWSVLADIAAAGPEGFKPGPADQVACYHLLHRDLVRPTQLWDPARYEVTGRGRRALEQRPR
jgi:hypothetical protein